MLCNINILFHNSDKMFPALGFGAKLPGGVVSHEFALVRFFLFLHSVYIMCLAKSCLFLPYN